MNCSTTADLTSCMDAMDKAKRLLAPFKKREQELWGRVLETECQQCGKKVVDLTPHRPTKTLGVCPHLWHELRKLVPPAPPSNPSPFDYPDSLSGIALEVIR